MSDHTLPLLSLQSETREIPLTQGKVAIVDAADYEWLMQWSWYAAKDRTTFYARRGFTASNGRRSTIQMHQLIVSNGVARVDHIDGNGLNNTRNNLRPATQQQNMFNRRTYKNNTSGFKGVLWYKQNNKWGARIRFNGKLRRLGFFATPIEAALAYDKAAVELFGEYAKLNFGVSA